MSLVSLLVGATGTALVTTIGAVVIALLRRGNNRAEADASTADADLSKATSWEKLLGTYEKRMDRYEREAKESRDRIASLEQQVQRMPGLETRLALALDYIHVLIAGWGSGPTPPPAPAGLSIPEHDT